MLHRTLAVICLALVYAAGCDTRPTHESIRKDGISEMKSYLGVLKDIKDESSAKAAKPKLVAINKELAAMEDEDGKLQPMLTPEQSTALDNKFKPEMEKLRSDLQTELTRIGKDEKAMAVIADVLPRG